MGTVAYNVMFTSGMERDCFAGDTFGVTISLASGYSLAPSGSTISSAEINFTSIAVYSAYEPRLQFGDLFYTAGLAQQATTGFLKAGVEAIPNSFLALSSTTCTATVVTAKKTRMLNIKAQATLVITYDEPRGSSTMTHTASLDAGGTMSVTISNDSISA